MSTKSTKEEIMLSALIHPYFIFGLFVGGTAGFLLACIFASSHGRHEEMLERMDFEDRAKKRMKAGVDVG
jgi:gas vesicle protein